MILVWIIYRIPWMNYVISLPAGIKDPEDANVLETAARELKEETGYIGENGRASYVWRTDPWKSDDRGTLVYYDIDLNKEENKNPQQQLESAEDITVMWVKLDGLRKTLEKIAQENKYDIDQRLYTFALGIEYAQENGITGAKI